MKEQLKTVVRGRDLLRTAMVSVPVAATGVVSRSSEAEARASGYPANSAETRNFHRIHRYPPRSEGISVLIKKDDAGRRSAAQQWATLSGKGVKSASHFMDGHAIAFGPFRLLAAQRLLLEGDKPVRLGSRAFDILAALVERAGEVVSKGELIARAWPDTFVEEANLKIQVSTLRRALGDGQRGHRYVVAVPGRGYNFVTPVRLEKRPRASLPPPIASAGAHNLPLAVTRMIGRDETVAALVSRLSRLRLLTIVGPGGIGKTTVALAVAERMTASYEHGVWLVDLAPLGDPRLVPSAVATVLGLEIRTEDPLPGLVAGLRDQRMLLLLDNCEHVIDAAASLAAAVLSGAPGINILATSRERLGTAGEGGYRLAPLSSPQPSSMLKAAEAEVFPAVQLFVERVTAIVEDFALTDANAPLVVEICRRLDGLPLAIEFAAPRVAVLGVEGLAARLEDNSPLLGARRRTTLPRHRTLRAVIDWSYGLLSEDEQRFFRALGIFTGGFTVEAAAAVPMDAASTRTDAIDRLADLVAKSLVVADVSGVKPRFRLLDTTRAYAVEKLEKSGERERIARRHAAYYRMLFKRAEDEVAARPAGEWLAGYIPEIDNLRAALSWCFGANGNVDIGFGLATGAAPAFLAMSLVTECHRWSERAILALDDATRGSCDEMHLQAAWGTSLMHMHGERDAARVALNRSLAIAEERGDAINQVRLLGRLHMFHLRSGDFKTALHCARRSCAVARTIENPVAIALAHSILGLSLHLIGDLSGARVELEAALQHGSGFQRTSTIYLGFDYHSRAAIVLARTLWLQGHPAQAVERALQAIKDAERADHPVSLTIVLHWAASVFLWIRDLPDAEKHIDWFIARAETHSLGPSVAIGGGFKGELAISRGDAKGGVENLQSCLEKLHAARYELLTTAFNISIIQGLAAMGQFAEGMTLIDETIRLVEANGDFSYMPELLRVKGGLFLSMSQPLVDNAEACFMQSLERSRRQGARAWELRAATSLAWLLRDQGRSADAIACLQPIYDRFTEGFDTADLIAAKQLLDDLADANCR